MSTPLAHEEDLRWSPDPERVEDAPYHLPLLDMGGRLKGRFGFDVDTDRMVEFAVTAQIEVAGYWVDVARIDTCHQEAHRHLYARTGVEIDRKVITPIYGPADVERGWEIGEEILLTKWDEHVRRWTCGR